MKIIRPDDDDPAGSLFMIPLLVEWNVKRCNVQGCRAKPTTIVTRLTKDVPVCGLCEKHYQQANVPGGIEFTLEFDDYDAFREKRNVPD